LVLGAVNLGDFDGEPGRDPALSVVAGFKTSCAIMQTGGLRCWGNNAYGQLGYDLSQASIGDDETPTVAYQAIGYADVPVFQAE
jgi:alpha-tubulin suppressor-like RCC1 family protein